MMRFCYISKRHHRNVEMRFVAMHVQQKHMHETCITAIVNVIISYSDAITKPSFYHLQYVFKMGFETHIEYASSQH